MDDKLARVVSQLSGDVQHAIAEPLGLGLGQISVEAGELGPRQEAAGDERDRYPGLVVTETVEEQIL